MNKKKIAIGTTIAGVLILGATASTAYAVDWNSASNEYHESYNKAITAKKQLEESNKNLEELGSIEDDDLTPQGRIAQASLKSFKSSGDSYYEIINDSPADPTWTQETSWNLRSKAKELYDDAESMEDTATIINDKIQTVKDEQSRQRSIKAKTALMSKLKDAEKLYSDSNGNVDDESSRKALKQWIDKTKSLLENGKLSEGKIYETKTSDSKKVFSAVNQAMKSRSDRLEEEAALAAIQASYPQPEQTESSGAVQAYQASQPSYNATSYYQPQYYQPQVQEAPQSASTQYRSDVNINCTVPDEATTNTCQGAVDQGGMVDIGYYGGKTHIYSQHNGTGGAWINNLKPGDSVSFGGKEYTVNNYNEQGATAAPFNGVYAQTCNENGNHIIGLTPKN